MILDLLDFIRLRICFTVLLISMSGYLLFASPDSGVLLAALSMFFVFSGGYAYNNIKDKAEDLLNRGRINPIVNADKKYIIVLFCFITGFICSLFFSGYSVATFLFILLLNFSYSFFSIKKYFLIKNLYTGFVISLAFLFGAAAASTLTAEVVIYYLLMSFFIFIGSLISDLRDYAGDKKTGTRTLPVILGFDKTKKLVYLLFSLFSFMVILLPKFTILLPFVLIMVWLLRKNVSFAHSFGGLSLIALIMWAVM